MTRWLGKRGGDSTNAPPEAGYRGSHIPSQPPLERGGAGLVGVKRGCPSGAIVLAIKRTVRFGRICPMHHPRAHSMVTRPRRNACGSRIGPRGEPEGSTVGGTKSAGLKTAKSSCALSTLAGIPFHSRHDFRDSGNLGTSQGDSRFRGNDAVVGASGAVIL